MTTWDRFADTFFNGKVMLKYLPDILWGVVVTIELAVLALVIAAGIGMPLGVLSATRRDSWPDIVARLISVAGLSMPGFWIGTLVLLYFSLWFRWIPPIAYVPLLEDPVKNLQQFGVPALALGAHFSAVTMRMTRSALLDVLRQDYVRTAYAKGLRERLVLARHALRNALLPAITVIGLEFTFLVGGLVVTEQVFNLNGIGQLFVQSVSRNDFTLIQGMVMLIAAFYVFVNLAIDLLYAVFDPRIRYGS